MVAALHLHCTSGTTSKAKLAFLFIHFSSKPRKALPSGEIRAYYLKISRVHLMPEDIRIFYLREQGQYLKFIYSAAVTNTCFSYNLNHLVQMGLLNHV